MEITEILLSAQSPNVNIRSAAEQKLKQFQEQSLPIFLLVLSAELSNEKKPPESRWLAGIILKNSLDVKNLARKRELTQQWINLDPSVKTQIRELVLRALGSTVSEARRTSSQVIAKIAAIEIPNKQWPELVEKLLCNIFNQAAQTFLKQSTYETLGYICEELSPHDLEQNEVNSILTVLVHGMSQSEHSPEVRLAAVKSLFNALDFAKTNFDNEMERNFIMKTLKKQEEDQDQDSDTWNLSMAGGTCLGLVARNVGDAIVPLVMPFVESNIVDNDWCRREAATFAFGSILEGPSIEELSPMIHSGFDFLLNAMKDPKNHVRSSTAWTLGRIFEFLHSPSNIESVITPVGLPRIMCVLMEAIKDAPNVAEKVCGALYFLAQGYENGGSNCSVLSPYFSEIISALLYTADRTDSSNFRLRASAYETLNEIIRCFTKSETSNFIPKLLNGIMNRLSQTLRLQIVSIGDREKQSDLQALLCGVLQVIIQKLGSFEETREIILHSSNQLMSLFLQVFSCHCSTVHEEAILAIGTLAYVTGPAFIKYMQEFYKYLEMGLRNFEEYQVCSISIGVVGDICRALDEKVLPYCDGILTHLLRDLSNPMLNRTVKPPIFSCLGDIALAIGEHFERYLPYVMPMLQGAADLCSCLDVNDEEMVEYGNNLRRSIFEAYTGLLQGFKDTNAGLMIPYVGHLLQFTEAIFRDKLRDEAVTKAAVAVMGDLADTLGPNTKIYFSGRTFHQDFLGECFKSDDDQLKQTASWTQGVIGRVLVS
ncbi:Importin subunit beta-1 [Ananas comosus]|uniref:Importin subunit beta-1 n=1 Tax=Ananas comosus TaxID=4615 RepID=A0A199VC11_ANACO|nr:Importin subunit beta-1 [Ananas comosus]